MISINKATIENFRAIEKMDVQLDGNGMVVILGANLDDSLSPGNGVGKTTLLSALKWGLFGESLEGDKGDDVLSWHEPKNCHVHLDLSNGEDTAAIDRYRKHKSGANTVVFTVNGVETDSARNKDVQTVINNFLGFDADMFTVLLTMAGMPKNKKPFLAMSDSEKKEFTDTILNLGYLQSAQGLVKADISVIAAKMENLTNQVNAAKAVKTQLESQLAEYDTMEQGYLTNKQTAIASLTARIAQSQIQIDEATKVLEELKLKRAGGPTKETAEYKDLMAKIYADDAEIKVINTANGVLYAKEADLKVSIRAAKDKITEDYKIDRSKIETPFSAEFLVLPEKLKGSTLEIKNTSAEIKRLQSQKAMYLAIPDEAQNEIRLLETKQNSVSSNISQLTSEYDRLREEAMALEGQLPGKSGICPKCKQPVPMEHLNKELALTIESMDTISTTISDYKEQLKDITAQITCKQDAIRAEQSATYDKLYSAAVAKYNTARDADTALKARQIELTALITTFRDAEVRKLTATRQTANEEALKSITEMELKLVEVGKEMAANYAKTKLLNDRILQTQSAMTQLLKESERIDKEINQQERNLDLIKGYQQSDILTLQDRQKENNPYQAMKEKNCLAITEKSAIINSLTNELKSLSNELDYLRFWEEGFGGTGLKSYILDAVTDLLNEKANYSLAKYSNTLKIQFKTQDKTKKGEIRDKFDVKIYNNGHETTFYHLSGGQQARVSIAVNYAYKILAEYYHNIRLNFTFVDEALDNLDSTGVEKVINFLREELNRHTSIFVVSHDALIKSLFDVSWLITYENGRSRLDVKR